MRSIFVYGTFFLNQKIYIKSNADTDDDDDDDRVECELHKME